MSDMIRQPRTIQDLIDSGDVLKVPSIDELDPDGHISQEVLNRLLFTISVGDPKSDEWMGKYIDNQDEIFLKELPVEFQEFYNLLEPKEKTEIQACTSLMTRIANLKFLFDKKFQTDNAELVKQFKKLYKLAEMRIMYFIKTKVSKILNEGLDAGETRDPSTVLNLYALRGARIFENQYSKLGTNKEIELKRLPLKKDAEHAEVQNYLVGVGREFSALFDMPVEEKAKIKDFILPDDCISTGMSEGGLIRVLELAGFNPERIIIPATVAVGGGLWHLQRIVAEIFPKCKLVLAAAEKCDAVNALMYLIKGRLFKVGDMGFFNEVETLTEEDVPTGEIPINVRKLNIINFHEAGQADILRMNLARAFELFTQEG